MAVTLNTRQPDYLHLKLLRDDVQRVAVYARGDLLDVGCGSQPYRDIFSRNVKRYIGIDLPPERWSGPQRPADDAEGMVRHRSTRRGFCRAFRQAVAYF